MAKGGFMIIMSGIVYIVKVVKTILVCCLDCEIADIDESVVLNHRGHELVFFKNGSYKSQAELEQKETKSWKKLHHKQQLMLTAVGILSSVIPTIILFGIMVLT